MAITDRVRTEVRHRESWTLTIQPGEGDTWPPITKNYTTKTIYRPDRITVAFSKGEGRYEVSLSGPRVRKDDSLGERVSERCYGTAPEWAQEIIEHELTKHRLVSAMLGSDE